LIPVGFGYGDGDEFFLRGWVWDSETRPRPAPLPSLLTTGSTRVSRVLDEPGQKSTRIKICKRISTQPDSNPW